MRYSYHYSARLVAGAGQEVLADGVAVTDTQVLVLEDFNKLKEVVHQNFLQVAPHTTPADLQITSLSLLGVIQPGERAGY